jgi:hypothetical protein
VVFAKFGMSRPFFAPPGLAPERLAALRRAFDATVRDQAFLADARKLGMEIDPVRGEGRGAGRTDHGHARRAGTAGARRIEAANRRNCEDDNGQ